MSKKIKFLITFLLIILLVNNALSQKNDSLFLAKFRDYSLDDSIRLRYLIKFLEYTYNYDSSFKALTDTALHLLEKTQIDSFYWGIFYNAVGKFLYFTDNTDSARVLLKKAIGIYKRCNSLKYLGISLGNLGNTYCLESNFVQCLKYLLEAQDIFYKTKDTSLIQIGELNIGSIYFYLHDTLKALNQFHKAYKLLENTKNYRNLAVATLNLAAIYYELGKYDSAKIYYKLTEKYAQKSNFLRIFGLAYSNMAHILLKENKIDSALILNQKAEKILKKINYLNGLISVYNTYATIYLKLKKIDKSKSYAKKAINIVKQTGLNEELANSYLILFRNDSLMGNFEQALKYYILYKKIEDSLTKEDVQTKIANIQANFDLKIKEKENALLKEKHLHQQKIIKRQKIILILSFILIVSFIMFFIQLYRTNKIIKKINIKLLKKTKLLQKQKEKIKKQKEIIQTHRNKLIKQQKDLTDSIIYASYIQKTLLPNLNIILKNFFQDWFLFYQPQNIISGDFYWAKKISEDKLFLIVGDCTGHGVPGALMSVMTIALLNDTLAELNEITAAEALNLGRVKIKKALISSSDYLSKSYGLDAAAIIFDKKNYKLNFAGAFRPLLIYRYNEIIELKGDKQPIAAYIEEKPFNDAFIDVFSNDMIYLFTDGITDQFSPQNGKFNIKRFKKLLLEIHSLPAEKQREKIASAFMNWKKDEDQTDDITVLGLRV